MLGPDKHNTSTHKGNYWICLVSTEHKLGEIKNDISGSSTSFEYTRLQTSLHERNVHGNGLGVG